MQSSQHFSISYINILILSKHPAERTFVALAGGGTSFTLQLNSEKNFVFYLYTQRFRYKQTLINQHANQ